MGLPVAQRVKVEAWLFEEGRTYEEVARECLREFGLKVSKSSVGRYYERKSAERFAKMQREKRQALEPKLSPSEAYKELLRRIAVLAWEEMDQPLKDINHKVVVRLVRVLIAAKREKHQETRVWVERRKAENWLARECLRHWRREMKKQAHVSYLPIWKDGPEQSGRRDAGSGDRDGRGPQGEHRNVVRVASEQLSRAESPALKRHECRAPGGGARDPQTQRRPWNNGFFMDNSPAGTAKAEKNLRGNTHKTTIGLQSGENSFTKFRTKTVLTIN